LPSNSPADGTQPAVVDGCLNIPMAQEFQGFFGKKTSKIKMLYEI
jgi:hypothetical protein